MKRADVFACPCQSMLETCQCGREYNKNIICHLGCTDYLRIDPTQRCIIFHAWRAQSKHQWVIPGKTPVWANPFPQSNVSGSTIPPPRGTQHWEWLNRRNRPSKLSKSRSLRSTPNAKRPSHPTVQKPAVPLPSQQPNTVAREDGGGIQECQMPTTFF